MSRRFATLAAMLVFVGSVSAACGELAGTQGSPSLPTPETEAHSETPTTGTTTEESTMVPAPDIHPSLPNGDVFFPKHKGGEVPASLAGGRLVTDRADCIRLQTPASGAAATVIWPPDYAANAEGGGISILDERGTTVARVGDEVSIGGGFVGGKNALEGLSGVDQRTKRELMERCGGRYFYAAPYVRAIGQE